MRRQPHDPVTPIPVPPLAPAPRQGPPPTLAAGRLRAGHDVFYFALDLSELDEVTRRLRLLSRNRRNVFSFRDVDHLVPPETGRTERAGRGPRPPPREGSRARRLADHPHHHPADLWATCSTRPASTCAVTARASCGSSSSRSTTRTATASSTRCNQSAAAAALGSAWTRRCTSRPSSAWMRSYRVRVQDDPDGAAHRHRRGRARARRCYRHPGAAAGLR